MYVLDPTYTISRCEWIMFISKINAIRRTVRNFIIQWS